MTYYFTSRDDCLNRFAFETYDSYKQDKYTLKTSRNSQKMNQLLLFVEHMVFYGIGFLFAFYTKLTKIMMKQNNLLWRKMKLVKKLIQLILVSLLLSVAL